MTITERINGLLSQVESMSAANAEELEALRIKYLSKKGEIARAKERPGRTTQLPKGHGY